MWLSFFVGQLSIALLLPSFPRLVSSNTSEPLVEFFTLELTTALGRIPSKD